MQKVNTDYSRTENLLQRFLTNNIPFVCYRLPGNPIIYFSSFSKNNLQLTRDLNTIPENTFVFYPFAENDNQQGLAIIPSITFNSETIPEEIPVNELRPERNDPELRKYTGRSNESIKSTYFSGIIEILKEINTGSVDKVVLSRTKFVPGYSIQDAPQILIPLMESYFEAFVYFLHIPGELAWMGATPEILLESHGKKFRTVSLAGTIASAKSDKANWRKKEFHEQGVVTDYIWNKLNKHKVSELHQQGPATVRAGNLLHLRSDFTFSTSESNFLTIASSLHPTPAVCGLPTSGAKEIIHRVEKHEREYYSGFVGPLNQNGNNHLFVNLRCMQFFRNGLLLYAGGGITKGSDPQEEWEETENKAKTLLSVIEKISKFA